MNGAHAGRGDARSGEHVAMGDYRTDKEREVVLIYRVRHIVSDFTRAAL